MTTPEGPSNTTSFSSSQKPSPRSLPLPLSFIAFFLGSASGMRLLSGSVLRILFGEEKTESVTILTLTWCCQRLSLSLWVRPPFLCSASPFICFTVWCLYLSISLYLVSPVHHFVSFLWWFSPCLPLSIAASLVSIQSSLHLSHPLFRHSSSSAISFIDLISSLLSLLLPFFLVIQYLPFLLSAIFVSFFSHFLISVTSSFLFSLFISLSLSFFSSFLPLLLPTFSASEWCCLF